MAEPPLCALVEGSYLRDGLFSVCCRLGTVWLDATRSTWIA